MDESMFGKLKYGRGDGRKRRAWVFGMVCRVTGRVVLWVCPMGKDGKFKRTKAALWPIIQANVLPGTTLYTDGFRGYRKLEEQQEVK
jgi:transposase-like protein